MALGNAYVSDPLAKVWRSAEDDIPGVRFGGAYADKEGYHNTRKRNQERWPSSYSIRLDMDKQGSALLAAALDLTMSTTEMKKRTGYLRRSALDSRDTRLRALREFIGTLDGRKVYCRIGGNAGLGQGRGADDWDRDSSHLWHIHLSILRAYANDWAALEGIASVLSGETWEAWVKRKWGAGAPTLPVSGIPDPLLREGAEGAAVLALQVYLNGAIGAGLVEDGDFGPATSTAVRELQRRAGITTTGIYDRDTAAALRHLLEDDDMSWDEEIPLITGQGVSYSGTKWKASFVLASLHYYELLNSAKLAAEQAKQTALLKTLAAAQSGLTEEVITAAVAEGVRQAIPSAEELAAAVAAAVDHELDVAAAAQALREVLGSVDEPSE